MNFWNRRFAPVILAAALLPPAGWAAEKATGEAIALAPVSRTVVDFDDGWRFHPGDLAAAMVPGFDDSGWRGLSVPHDWSIESPTSAEFASGTGFAPGGVGWYRKHFRLDGAARNRRVTVEFDGIYNHAEVWINGHFVGGRPYGYSSFACELTPLLKWDGAENVLAVRVDHSKFADSRWYTGSGIYRHVRLCSTGKLRIAPWGVFVTTPEVRADAAVVRVETEVRNNAAATSLTLVSEILDTNQMVVAAQKTALEMPAGTNRFLTQEIKVAQPRLWSVAAPNLYTLRSRLIVGDVVMDETTTPFGIRAFHFDPNQGFSLNGEPMKIKGVCLHHDAGPLGAAVPEQVLERRLLVLRSLGVNAIRTSHNPPAPELLNLCDRLGLLVKDEAFDEYTPAKNKWMAGWNSATPSRFGYAESFTEWAARDVADMVRRDRNHPSVIMWSIGNELDYANDPFSHPVLGGSYHPENPPAENLVKLGRPLAQIVRQLDPTRPVTAALANVPMSDAVGFPDLLDVVGYNYQESRYAADHAAHPRRVIFGSENSHAWEAWRAVVDNDFISGQFLWTGIDYLGEARTWPNRASSAGLLDLCGFKKPLAWFRQSLWSREPMVYLCASAGRRLAESWNWNTNDTVTVHCYTTCPEVELSRNGRSLGTQRLADATKGELTWRVPFAPGTLTATARDGAKTLSEFFLKTAGAAQRIELLPDRPQLTGKKDICHVEFRIVDAAGVLVPDADNDVTFTLAGPARMLGLGNGDPNSTQCYQGDRFRAFHGRGLVILQTTGAGNITLQAETAGLEPARADITSR